MKNLRDHGPGLTGDRNFQSSVEYYEKGMHFRRIRYGVTREEILEEISQSDPRADWEDHWVVGKTRTVAMGLGSQWTQVARGYDKSYHMI